ncbi:uncharacterized protein BP01DRAFT_368305 [Aspergillus saccharolyticus JOP 1030-1]|uniref:Uncharacterized protein n=1 Tax=Aspergillus saccharolyticus JOP 1030-1 TaxID=1450539 RepID=A0A318Z5D4_9EURO|nr:hypothetical protein BP01DRAFT_368305 [Aspergillus saccharolyticus JOP 1030-1]PYH42279.1 hypothetical protein BP01DRAFT_368305 [Aspergillus saccharolyticus JOP 1030-1]
MPVTWNSEANAKLFLGVLTQLRNQNVKLDYHALAGFVGSECSVRAVQQQMDRLRKQANESVSNSNPPAGTPTKQRATNAPSGKTTPTAKRKAGRIATKTPTKKMKPGSEDAVAEEEEEEEEEQEEEESVTISPSSTSL